MPDLSLADATYAELASKLRNDELSVVQVVKDHIARYELRDDVVHAWSFLDKGRALREAEKLDEIPVEERGPLHGMVIGVKDMMNTKDMPTEHGSPIYKDNQPSVDAGAIAICRSLGAVIYGKTHTTEFATTHQGTPCANPHDPTRTPGGSSSGSAAAVADYQCQIAFGTQTGGSMMRPASFNGVYGIKYTFGAVTKEGLKTCSHTLDTFGVFARSISDLQIISRALGVQDDVPPQNPPKSISAMRFAFVKTDVWDVPPGASPDLHSAWITAHDLLRKAGAEVIDLDLPNEFDGLSTISHHHLQSGESRRTFLPEHLSHRDLLHPDIRGLNDSQTRITNKQLLAAQDRFAALRPVIDGIAVEFDALITPSTPGVAPLGLEWTGDPRFCRMWTGLGVPCLNVPGLKGEGGMPIGLTLVAPRFEDERLLGVASAVAEVFRAR